MRQKEEEKYEDAVKNLIQDKKDALERKKARRFDSVNVIEDDLSFDEKEIEFGFS